MDSKALKTFRRKMANPLHWKKANKIILEYTKEDLADVLRTLKLIDQLSTELGVPLTSAERVDAAGWLVKQGIDPQNRLQRLSIWKKAK